MPGFGLEVVAACLFLVAARAWLGDRLTSSRRDWLVAVVSLLVIASWQPSGLLLTLLLTGLTWLAIRPGRLTRVPTALVAFVLLSPLVVFKYGPWLTSHLGPGWQPGSTWLVPLGISFTVFRLIGAVMDARALRLQPAGSRLFLLACLFPTLPSGPIATLQSLKPVGGGALRQDVAEGNRRILGGLARKVLLADPLYGLVIGPWLQLGVSSLEPYQCLVLPVLLGFYVYWDFAGYSDVAIGVARLVGYRVPENFNAPYLSRNVVEFWRRWHITLSEWIRTRLMMKMAGRRAGPWRLRAATLTSMALCGLWHGAGVGYLLWGLWHGVGLIAVHAFREVRSRRGGNTSETPGTTSAMATATTFAFVSLGWVLFFLTPVDGLHLVAGALRWRGGAGVASLVPAVTVVLLALAYLARGRVAPALARVPQPLRHGAVAVVLGLLTYALVLTSSQPREFIYARF